MTSDDVRSTGPADITLSPTGRALVLVAAFLGWMFAGTIMAIVPVAGRPAMASMVGTNEGEVGAWFSRYICSFLLGAASGGILFGWLGDKIGRARAMGLSILCYSVVTWLSAWATNPYELLAMCFIACLGIGGMWPNGVALVSESWPNVSRPWLSGLIGASANFGFMLLSFIASRRAVTPDDWRWLMNSAAAPAMLGFIVLLIVPESPRWLLGRSDAKSLSPLVELWRPALVRRTILGILLGGIPFMGNWGSANWLVPWADQVADVVDPSLKAWTQWNKSFGGAVGSLLGGVIATLLGRRTTYFVISVISLVISFSIFRFLTPTHPLFLYAAFAIGFTGTLYFGWLPLFLPELFPMRVRATGAGATFNLGRVATAIGVLGTGQLFVLYNGDYAKVGQITCLVYVAGMIVIWFAPDTSKSDLRV